MAVVSEVPDSARGPTAVVLRRVARLALIALAALAVGGGGLVGYLWWSVFGPGHSPESRARILAHDAKFGRRAIGRAIGDGDAIVEPLRRETGDFRRLNGRNAEWIAEVLGALDTGQGKAVLRELYGRTNRVLRLSRLVGTVGLARQRSLPEPILGDHLLQEALRGAGSSEERRLAVQALGYAGDIRAVGLLVPLLAEPGDYWVQAHVCVALARLQAREAVPVLRERLRSAEFHALPEAFRALVALGDREAVPLAIARIEPAIRDRNSGFVVNELRKVTGQRLGWEQDPWRRWWQGVEATWSIPPAFRAPWDEQPRMY